MLCSEAALFDEAQVGAAKVAAGVGLLGGVEQPDEEG